MPMRKVPKRKVDSRGKVVLEVMTADTRRTRLDPLRFATPSGYEAWTAHHKAHWLWKNLILATAHDTTALPSLTLPFRTSLLREMGVVLRRSELDKALTRTSDLMEPGRPKLIHAKGAVARVDYTPHSSSRYTGLLAPVADGGGAHGLLRMSLVARVFGDAAYTPALALKLLIDSKPSADVLAMNHTVGQGRDYNVFSNTMTNDLRFTHNELRTAQRLMSVFFRRVSHQPRRMVTTHLCNQTQDGVSVGSPVTPERLLFEPTTEARSIFVGQAGVDFRLVLADLPVNTRLFDVYAVNASNREPSREPIGHITMTTPFVSSDGGDRLFFRHVHDPADRKCPV